MTISRILRRLLIGVLCLLIIATSMIGSSRMLLAATPTPPADLLNAAGIALFDGDYDTALVLYTSAATQADLKCDALFGLGVTNLRNTLYTAADAAFTRSLTECPPTFRSLVLRGDTRRAMQKNEDALADYQQALALNPGLIDSYVYERMASVSTDQAVGYLVNAADSPRPAAGEVLLRKRLVTIFKALDDTRSLEQQHTAILAVAQSSEDLAEAEDALGNLQLDNGQTADGYKHLAHVLNTYPALTPAFDALLTLVTAGQDVDLLTRSRVNITNSNFRPVINKLATYLPANSTDPAAPELYVLLAKAQRGINNTADALTNLQKVRDAYPKDPMASVAALEQGITYEGTKDYQNALRAYKDTASIYPDSPEAPRALWKAAQVEATISQPAAAVALYDQLAKQYPSSDLALPALSQAGTLLASTDPAHAADFFGRMGNAEGFLWQGKMLDTLKDSAGAQKAWTTAAAKEPGTFFSLRAQELLTGAAPFHPADKANFSPGSDPGAAALWVQKSFKLATVSTALSPALGRDPMLIRGVELWGLGWWQEAIAEFDALYAAHRDDAAGLLQLAVYFKGLGVYRSSIMAAARLITLSGAAIKDTPPLIAQLAYPIDYPDLLIPTAQTEELDPLFVATIIRTESRFDPHALSSAQDTGLMQMIPSTAQGIQAQLQINNFQDSDLYRPIISLKFGSRYLSSLRSGLSGNLAAVIVGYNAGGDYALKLLLSSGGDVDRFYNGIDLNSVQTYLSYAYEEYAAYRQIYR